MQTMRWMAVLGAAAVLAAASSFAQVQAPPAAEATKPAPKAADKKATPEKATAAKKAVPKKDAAKKEAPKKAAAKKTDADAKKPTIHSTKTMELRDEKGNIIPTNPDAYDVSSALPGKPPPKKK